MRGDRIDRIEDRIVRLGERATKLLRREHAVKRTIEDLRGATGARARRQARAERSLGRLRAEREELVETELHVITLALEQQSRRTRDRLDRELERLAPVQAEWERLRGAFETLGATVATPAFEDLAGQWRGGLSVPEFPVREPEGYTRPFPEQALLF
jgi:chromosome segregation ATPase